MEEHNKLAGRIIISDHPELYWVSFRTNYRIALEKLFQELKKNAPKSKIGYNVIKMYAAEFFFFNFLQAITKKITNNS